MTSAPYQPYPPAEQLPGGATSNLMGLIGFVASILGFITCGVLAPIGLILSLIGLFKRPRGFAIAGTIISLIGCVLLLVMTVVFGSAVWAANAMGPELSFQTASGLISQHHGATAPDDAAGQATLDTQMKDAQWMIAIPRYRKVSDTSYELTVPGEDGQFGTADDEATVVDAAAGYQMDLPDADVEVEAPVESAPEGPDAPEVPETPAAGGM